MITDIKDKYELIEILKYAIADYKEQENDREVTAEIHISLDLGRVKIEVIED